MEDTASEYDESPREDQRVFIRGSWDDYERLLKMRGESAHPRIAFLKGEIELMSPSDGHETTKTMLGRLLEAWSDEMGVDIEGYGSWTIRRKKDERGLEPDECYMVGERRKKRPDLALEVNWTSGGLDKLEIYRKLGVPEVWIWERALARIDVWVLGRDGKYRRRQRSAVLPTVDLELIERCARARTQSQAVRKLRAALRKSKRTH